jgi:pimeloyl-ACP methyl ester carboxylesterase
MAGALRLILVEYILKDKNKTDLILGITRLLSPYKLRKAGTNLDMKLCSELPIHIDVSKITCPSFIVHGTHDGDVLFYHGVWAADNIANAQSHWAYEGSHFSFWTSYDADKIQQQAKQFLAEHAN